MLLLGSVWFALPSKAAINYRSASFGDNAAGATTIVIDTPAGAAVGDVLVVSIAHVHYSGFTFMSAAGFTPVQRTTDSSSIVQFTGYRVLTATPPASYTFTFQSDDIGGTASVKAAGGIIAYSGVDTASPVMTSAAQTNASSTTMTAPAVTTTTANAMIIAFHGTAIAGTVTAGSSMTQRYQATSGGGGSAGTKRTSAGQDVLQAVAGSSGTKTATNSAAAVNIGHTVALSPEPVVSQVSYRWFANQDSTTVGAPLASANTSATAPSVGTPFRLRLNLGVSEAPLSSANFKLRFAARDGDNICNNSGSELYNDITTTSLLQYYNNPSVADAAAYVSSVNDPTRSGITAIGQRYEELNNFSVANAIAAGEDGLWDFALMLGNVPANTTYCIKATYATGGDLNGGYGASALATITTPALSLSQDNYRFYANADSVTPGAPLAAQNTVPGIAPQTPFRLRSLVGASGVSAAQSSQNLKLEYAERVGAVCNLDMTTTDEVYVSMAPPGSASTSTENQLASSAQISHPAPTTNSAWGTPENVTVADGMYASHSGAFDGEQSNYLVSNADFATAIPNGANIVGIEATIKGFIVSNVNLSFGGEVRIATDATTLKGQSKSIVMSDADTAVTVGGPTDLWGTTWSPSDFESLDGPGAAFAKYTQATDMVYIDYSYITVYYTTGGGTGAISFQNNLSAASGDQISSSGNDPTASGTIRYQNYQETDLFSNTRSAIAAGEYGLWDFALNSDATTAGKTYCFRTVKSDGSPLESYAQVASMTFNGGSAPVPLPMQQRLRGGQGVVDGVKSPFDL